MVQNLDKLKKQRDIVWTEKHLKDFEVDIRDNWEAGNIRGPVHLSGGNEKELIEIFQYVHPDDWVFSTWRSHYHALLHGVFHKKLKQDILDGSSITLCSSDNNFVTSAIVGGILPIAAGVAQSLKNKNSDRKVWCFVGDMAFETGDFHLTYKYCKNFDLPIQFVVEDNEISTNTPTIETWKKKSTIPDDVIYYKYERIYPHYGTGKWVVF
tara:strand:- start:1442 stop:2071 length:630 start_codon:yes stop_codon:yes gene_type:complete